MGKCHRKCTCVYVYVCYTKGHTSQTTNEYCLIHHNKYANNNQSNITVFMIANTCGIELTMCWRLVRRVCPGRWLFGQSHSSHVICRVSRTISLPTAHGFFALDVARGFVYTWPCSWLNLHQQICSTRRFVKWRKKGSRGRWTTVNQYTYVCMCYSYTRTVRYCANSASLRVTLLEKLSMVCIGFVWPNKGGGTMETHCRGRPR